MIGLRVGNPGVTFYDPFHSLRKLIVSGTTESREPLISRLSWTPVTFLLNIWSEYLHL